jgi:hypothetical protein
MIKDAVIVRKASNVHVPQDFKVDVLVFRIARFLVVAGAVAVGRNSVALHSDVHIAI